MSRIKGRKRCFLLYLAPPTTWAKETAIWLKETQALTWPTVWKSATGSSARSRFQDTAGTGCSRVAHSTAMQAALAAAVSHQGHPGGRMGASWLQV